MIPGRIVALALAVALLFGAGIAVAATRDSDKDSEAGGPAVIDQPEPTTSSTSPATTTSTPETSTTQVAQTTTTRRVTTTVVRPTSTTRAPTTTTTAAALRDCTAAQIEVMATTDKRSYGPTEQVKFESTLRNRSSTACSYAGYTFQATFADPGGRRIIEVITVADERVPKALVPGAVLTGAVPFDQGACQQQPCPTLTRGGGYSATATWGFPGGPYLASATFTLS